MMTVIRIVFVLIVVGVIVALIANQCKKTGKPFPWGWVGTIVGVLLVSLLLFWGCSGHKPAPPPPTVRVIVPTERLWTSRTFEIPPEGLRIRLEAGPKIYPKFGAITEETPSGITNKNEPGIDRSFGFEPSGYWTFRADPPGSIRLVEIYNRWQ